MLTNGAKSDLYDQPLMPQSHQTFCPVSAMKLLGIVFRNRCWHTTIYIITVGDPDEWCLN